MSKTFKMTRFARSKGSKASNERVEEEATPWEELKAQIAPVSKKNHFNVEDLEDEPDVNEIESEPSELLSRHFWSFFVSF